MKIQTRTRIFIFRVVFCAIFIGLPDVVSNFPQICAEGLFISSSFARHIAKKDTISKAVSFEAWQAKTHHNHLKCAPFWPGSEA